MRKAAVALVWWVTPLAALSPPEVLRTECLSCHGQGQIMSGLDLRSREALLKGGKRGPAIVPGNASASLLVDALEGRGELKMPPGKILAPEAIAAVRAWIDAGAPWSSAPLDRWSTGASAHWAFQPLRKGQPGETIDQFIARKLQERGLEPAPPADRRTLIRRATFDLTGLPPTPGEIQAFLRDRSPAAFRKLVERLLASPRYGERWGRHWLDVVRYADSDGYSNDFERPHAWRYRDYVIRSFNRDKPYDRFVLEQIAGDELNSGDAESLIATGFLRMGPWEHTAMSVAAVTRQMFLDDVTHHTATTFLGLTLGCARCHDHKFDPIPTREYYGMQAIFAFAEFAAPRVPFLPEENVSGFAEGRRRVEEMIRRTEARLEAHDEIVRQTLLRARGVKTIEELPKEVVREALRKKQGLSPEDLARDAAYRKRLEIYRRALERYDAVSFSVKDGGQPAETFVLRGGDLKAPGEKVAPGVLRSAVYWGADPAVPAGAEGRRLALARWIADPANPLTARVMVNRIWQWHFGAGLVETANNFGKMGKPPSHPELLDWLAAYFIEHGWSVKQMHRAIMLTEAYQRSSRRPAKAAEADPENRLLSFFSPRRLEAEELRDSILAVSGELSPDAGGPGTFPEINEDVAEQPRLIMGQIAPAYQASATRRERNRRSVYTFQKRSIPDPVVEAFNAADSNESCERRQASVVPTQAFALFNSKFAHDMARAFALRVEKAASGRATQVDLAFRLCFGRTPEPAERALVLEHVARMEARHQSFPPEAEPLRKPGVRSLVHELTGQKFDLEEEEPPGRYEENLRPQDVNPGTRALADALLVLLNSNEFVYVY